MIKQLSRLALQSGLLSHITPLVRLYLHFTKTRVINEESVLSHLTRGGHMIAAIWHQRIFIVMGYARRFSIYQPSVMISQSRDGDMIAEIYSRFNFRPVRGSSSRGGKEALLAMVEDLSLHQMAVHVLDGPRGPRGVVKPGVIVLAQLSGAPIFPVYVSANRAWVLNSWDRTLVPKPFSTIVVRWDDPIVVPPHLDSDSFEQTRKLLEQRMKDHQARDDTVLGWRSSLL